MKAVMYPIQNKMRFKFTQPSPMSENDGVSVAVLPVVTAIIGALHIFFYYEMFIRGDLLKKGYHITNRNFNSGRGNSCVTPATYIVSHVFCVLSNFVGMDPMKILQTTRKEIV